jgi:3-deoxy-alpha-D-manno-octulosonate 8-oxidase
MVEKNKIDIPQNITAGLSDDDFDKMINVSLGMKPLWENALGKNWEKQMTRDKLRKLYERFKNKSPPPKRGLLFYSGR